MNLVEMICPMVVNGEEENPCVPSSNGLMFNEPIACVQEYVIFDSYLNWLARKLENEVEK